MQISNVRKAIVAFSGFVAVIAAVTADGQVDVQDGAAMAVALVTAVGVYFAPNKPVE